MRTNDSNYKELADYASIDSRGYGYYLADLLAVRDHAEDSGMTIEFSEALDKELEHWLSNYKTMSKIETSTRTQPDNVSYSLIEKEAAHAKG